MVTNIDRQRLIRWYGHSQRLPEESPAKQALYEIERRVEKPVGRPMVTWIETVTKQLKEKGIEYEEARKMTQDREKWRNFINK